MGELTFQNHSTNTLCEISLQPVFLALPALRLCACREFVLPTKVYIQSLCKTKSVVMLLLDRNQRTALPVSLFLLNPPPPKKCHLMKARRPLVSCIF